MRRSGFWSRTSARSWSELSTTSTIPAFKAALLDALQARTGLAGVQIEWGLPQSEPQDELIMLLDVSGEQVWAPMGRLHKEETYTLDLWISVLRSGGEQQTASERAFELLAEVEGFLRGDVSVGGTVRTAALQGLTFNERALSAAKREAQIKSAIFCTARLTTS